MPEPRHIYPRHFFATPVPREPTGFILMPFDFAFDAVHEAIAAAIERSGLQPVRADDVFLTRAALEKILRGIGEAEVVVADVTGRNANVFYEVGIAHAVKDNVILIAQDLERDVPFDLRHIDHVIYTQDESGLIELASRLEEVIRSLDPEPEHSPAESTAPQSATAADLRVLSWNMNPNSPHRGLHIKNFGDGIASDVWAERLMPTGKAECSSSCPDLMTGDEHGIVRDWLDSTPADPPSDPAPSEKYFTRVHWSDEDGSERSSTWKITGKVS